MWAIIEMVHESRMGGCSGLATVLAETDWNEPPLDSLSATEAIFCRLYGLL